MKGIQKNNPCQKLEGLLCIQSKKGRDFKKRKIEDFETEMRESFEYTKRKF